jgi:RNA polymerase sigma factor (TIGR02999 family)
MNEACTISRLLRAHQGGEQSAFNRMVPLVYDEFRRLARNQLRRLPGCLTLNTTGLVHEAYLKLAESPGLLLNDRGHLMAVTARAMGQVLVSRARDRLRAKRGGGARPVELDESQQRSESDAEQILDLDRALSRLREHSPELARINPHQAGAPADQYALAALAYEPGRAHRCAGGSSYRRRRARQRRPWGSRRAPGTRRDA